MAIVALYPALTSADDARDVLTRLVRHLAPAPADGRVSEIVLVSSLGPLQIAALEAPDRLDPAFGPATLADLGDRITAYPVHGTDAAAWVRLIGAADLLYVWRRPEAAASGAAPFAGLDALTGALAAAGVATPVCLADPHADADETARLVAAVAALAGPADESDAQTGARLDTVLAGLAGRAAHLVGAGASAEQIGHPALHAPLEAGDVVADGALVGDLAWLTALGPALVCAGNTALHVGPSAAAARVRKDLAAAMDALDFTLVVPERDLALHRAALDPAHRDRIVAVPAAVAPGGDALAFMLAVAATHYGSITVSGFDGLAMPAALEADFRAAHPATARALETGAADPAGDPVERAAATAEAAGAIVTALTASDRPALRRRGAAAPLGVVSRGDPDAPPTVLSVAPDLIRRDGEAFAAERLLAAALEAEGARVRIAASQHMRPAPADGDATAVEAQDEDDGETAAPPVDPVLTTASRTLGLAARRDPAALGLLRRRAEGELRRAVAHALADAPGRLVVFMAAGSLEHLDVLRAIALEEERVGVLVGLATLTTGEIWETDFTARHADVLHALATDPAIHAMVPTVHQQAALAARTGITLPVAPLPSPLVPDAVARAVVSGPPRRSRSETPDPSGSPAAARVLLPAARTAEGLALSAATGAALRSLLADMPLNLVFGADPLAGLPADTEALRAALGPYEVAGGLAGEALQAEIAAADAVVFPVTPPDFTDRPLRLAVECLAAQTPVVAVAGTWLAAFVTAHRSGLAVDVAAPRALAEAAAQLVRSGRAGMMDLRFGAGASLTANGWGALAGRILAAARLPKEAAWRRGEAAHADTLRPAALPLLTVPDEENGERRQIDYGRFVDALGLMGEGDHLLWSGPRTVLADPGRGLGRDEDTDGEGLPGGDLIVDDPHVFAALRAAPATARHHAAAADWSIEDARPLVLEARTSRLATLTARALDGAGPETAVLLLERFEERVAPALWRALARAPRPVVVIGVDRPAFAWPGRVAAHLAEELERQGWRVALVERGPAPASIHGAEPAPVRRVTLGPVWPARPDIPCDVVAVRAAAAGWPSPDALRLRAAFAAALTSSDLGPPAFAAPSSAGGTGTSAPADPAAEDTPLPMSPEATATAVRDPGTGGWMLASLAEAGDMEAGFVPLAEIEAADRRVHTAGVRIEGDAPLTVSVEVQPLTTRYVTLQLTDMRNRLLAAAVFDLVDATVISATRDPRLAASAPRATITAPPAGDDTAAGVTAQEAPAQEVTAQKAGTEEAGTVRRLSLSLEDLAPVGPLQAQVVLRQDASGSVHYMGSPARRIGLRNLLVEWRAEPSRLPPEGIPGALPPLPAASSPAAAEGGAPAAPQLPAGPEPLSIELTTREAGTDPLVHWVTDAKAVLERSEDGLVFQRGGAPYSGQFATRVDVGLTGPYEVVFDFAAVEPEVHLVVDDKVVRRIDAPGEVVVDVGATSRQIAVELRGANSHTARFVLRGLKVVRVA